MKNYKVTLYLAIDGEITKDGLRMTIDDAGKLVLYPKDEELGIQAACLDEVEEYNEEK